jgi:hypothetical protein
MIERHLLVLLPVPEHHKVITLRALFRAAAAVLLVIGQFSGQTVQLAEAAHDDPLETVALLKNIRNHDSVVGVR